MQFNRSSLLLVVLSATSMVAAETEQGRGPMKLRRERNLKSGGKGGGKGKGDSGFLNGVANCQFDLIGLPGGKGGKSGKTGKGGSTSGRFGLNGSSSSKSKSSKSKGSKSVPLPVLPNSCATCVSDYTTLISRINTQQLAGNVDVGICNGQTIAFPTEDEGILINAVGLDATNNKDTTLTCCGTGCAFDGGSELAVGALLDRTVPLVRINVAGTVNFKGIAFQNVEVSENGGFDTVDDVALAGAVEILASSVVTFDGVTVDNVNNFNDAVLAIDNLQQRQAVFIKNSETTIKDSTFTDNDSTTGTVDIRGGSLKVMNSQFSENFSSYSGGALHVIGAALEVYGSTFEDNSSLSVGDGIIFRLDCGGGAIVHRGNRAYLEGNTFNRNESTNGEIDIPGIVEATGGAVCTDGSAVEMVNNVFTDNSADNEGGAVKSVGGSLFLLKNRFVENSVIGIPNVPLLTPLFSAGGAVYTEGTILTAVDNYFEDNTLIEGGIGDFNSGGALTVSGGVALVESNTFVGNDSGNDGGAIAVVAASADLVCNTLGTGSADDDAAALQLSEGATVTSAGNEYIENQAGDKGGAIKIDDASLRSVRDTFLGNLADDSGNDIYVQRGALITCGSSPATLSIGDDDSFQNRISLNDCSAI